MGGRVRTVSILLAVAVLGGCSEDDASFRRDGESAAEFAHRIVHDEKATPAEIAAAGQKASTYTFEGRTLRTYVVHDTSDGGETESQRAWRLFDTDGTLLAEAKTIGGQWVRVLSTGFLVQDGRTASSTYVAPDGTVTPLEVGAPRATRAGDQLVAEDYGRPVAYRQGVRPGDPGSAARILLPPAENIQRIQLAADGSLWIQDAPEPGRGIAEHVIWSSGGRPWHTEPVPFPAGSEALASIRAFGDRVYLFSIRRDAKRRGTVDALLWRPTAPAGRWQSIDLTGAGFELGDTQPRIRVEPDGTVVVANRNGEFARVGDQWQPLP